MTERERYDKLELEKERGLFKAIIEWLFVFAAAFAVVLFIAAIILK